MPMKHIKFIQLPLSLITIFATLLLSYGAVHADSNSCSLTEISFSKSSSGCTAFKELADGISWKLRQFPLDHQAGEKTCFDLILHKKVNLLERAGSQIVLFAEIGEFLLPLLENGALTEFFRSTNTTHTFHIDKMIGKNVGGKASLALNVVGYVSAESMTLCALKIGLGSDSSFQIHSDNIDLTPPAVIGIRYSKASYQPGENITAYIAFSEELKDLNTHHITFRNDDGDFPPYSRSGLQLLRTSSEGYEYAVEFDPKREVPRGRYFLTCFNRQDIHGNFASDKEIAVLAPLIIEAKTP